MELSGFEAIKCRVPLDMAAGTQDVPSWSQCMTPGHL